MANKDDDLLGGISIELIDADLRPYSSFTFVADLQDAVPRHPMLETISFRGWRGGPGGDAIDIQLSGASSETLKAAAESLKAQLARYGEVSALEDNLAYDKEELVLELTPQGQALGLTIDDLGGTLRARLNGIEAATYPEGPRSAAIRVEVPSGELTADFVERMLIRTGPAQAGQGVYVPLADIVTVERRTGFRPSGAKTASAWSRSPAICPRTTPTAPPRSVTRSERSSCRNSKRISASRPICRASPSKSATSSRTQPQA